METAVVAGGEPLPVLKHTWCAGCAAFLPQEAFSSASAIKKRRRCKACTSVQNSIYRQRAAAAREGSRNQHDGGGVVAGAAE